MKAKIFNTLVAIVGMGSMVTYAMNAGVNTNLGTLVMLGVGTSIVSLIGTVALIGMEDRKNARKEREYVEMLEKAYKINK